MRALVLLFAGVAMSCATERVYETNVELLRLRPIRRDVDDPTMVLTIDVEVSYGECPGEQRKTIRGDKTFASCILEHGVGDKVAAKIRLARDESSGTYRNSIVKLGDCDRRPDPNDEASFEVVQDCEDVLVNGVVVGVHCDRTRSKALLAKCPWFRQR